MIALVLMVFYRRYSLTYGVNTDFANMLLQGEAMLKGNVLLSHWYLTTVTWYTTDVPLYALGVALRGFDPVLLHEVPIVVYTALLLSALYLGGSRRLRNLEQGWKGMLIVFALIGLPMESMGVHLLLGPFRTSTVLLTLLAYVCIDRNPDEAEDIPLPRVLLFGALLVVALVADNFPLYTAVLPILLISFWRVWQLKSPWRPEAVIAGTAIAATLVAKLCLRAIRAAGGFVMPDSYASHIKIVPLEHLWRNICWSVEGLQSLFGCDFWGQEVGARLLVVVLRLLLPGLLFYGMWVVLKPLINRKERAATPLAPLEDRVSLYLATGMAINLLAYTFGNLSVGLESARYLVPFSVFGAILAARSVTRDEEPSRERQRQRTFFAAVAGILLVVPSVARLSTRPFPDPPARRLAETLLSQSLTDGYGAYWCGTDVVVQSRKKVRVRALEGGDKGLHPYLFGADERWYAEGVPAYFVVLDEQNFGGVNRESATRTFGEPIRTFKQDHYTVLVYDKDISPRLINKP